MDETGIAWPSDKQDKFAQPKAFKSVPVTDLSLSCNDSSVNLPAGCKSYKDSNTGTMYKFYYPNDDTTQYLYETYPGIISPINGVTDEHFMVWMRTASLPTFRKLYGKISGNFQEVEKITFDIVANYEVQSFQGKKSLVISTPGNLDTNGNAFVGSFVWTLGCLFLTSSLIWIFFFLSPSSRFFFSFFF